MRLRTLAPLSAAALLALTVAAPAAAHPDQPGIADAEGRVFDGPPPPGMHPDMRPDWREHDMRGPGPGPEGRRDGWDRGAWEAQRGEWLAECRRRYRTSDNGVGGAIIGGVVGGVLGNRIAGRGNRTIGTVLGAGVGAVAGAAIDKAEDRGRGGDYCESYFDYYTHAGQGYGGYGYQLAAPMMMVPVMMVQAQGQRECVETVTTTEEWVTVPGRHRYIPRRPVYHDKRVRIAPTKRVPM